MSDATQNQRSPEQQLAEIQREIKQQRRPWKIAKVYTDAAMKGGYIDRRPQFKAMRTDIRAGLIKADAILVDTAERLGRADEIPIIRQQLWNHHGCVVLTADSRFHDPTTSAGRALAMVEQIRSTEGNNVKAHDVWRGKMDLVEQLKWPGGPAPFGKKIVRRVTIDAKGKEVVESDFIPDPETGWIAKHILLLALETKVGDPQLAAMLNADPQIPDKVKPFLPSTVGNILKNRVNCGQLSWGVKCCGILNDTRVQQKNPDGAVVFDGFCEPLITVEEFEEIQRLRRIRSDAIKEARAAKAARREPEDLKQIVALATGMTLKYLLTGLVFCGECNARMVPTSSTGDSRDGTRYAYYRCPTCCSTVSTACKNGLYVREDKLREAVLSRIRAQLFPAPVIADGKVVEVPDWLPAIDQAIRDELRQLREQTPTHAADLAAQLAAKRDEVEGLQLSLRKKDLSSRVRDSLETTLGELLDSIDKLESEKDATQHEARSLELVLDTEKVLENLQQLHDVLAGGNVTDGNAELSLHVEGIYCFANGEIQMRTCKLGLFAGALEMLSRSELPPVARGGVKAGIPVTSPESPSKGELALPPVQYRVTSRRRTRLRTSHDQSFANPADSVRLVCHERFQNLDPKWFWHDLVFVERRSSWAHENAAAVWALHQQHPDWSHNKLARAFPQVTRPTVVHALRIAHKRWDGGEGDGAAGATPQVPTNTPPVSPRSARDLSA
jgi:DNA invertase Pin-like site-specific DNA recombinase